VLGAVLATAMIFSVADVRAIGKACDAPSSWFTMRDGSAHFSPPPTAAYKRVDCVLAGMNELATKRGQKSDVGFVGNAGPAPEKPE
jgi:hypothetical protein